MTNKKINCALLIIIASWMTVVSASTPISQTITFGDSLSDIGNNSWIHARGAPITNLDSAGQRYLYVNYLSERAVSPSASIDKWGNIINPITKSISYAWDSADTSSNYLEADWPGETPIPAISSECTQPGLIKDTQGDVQRACVPGLLKQVGLYTDYMQKRKQQPDLHTLFFIWAGANDLLYITDQSKVPGTIIQAVGNIVTAVNALEGIGVKPEQIYVINLPDLGKTPYARQYPDKQENYTIVSISFNNGLQRALTQPSAEYSKAPLPVTHVLSAFDQFNEFIGQPEKYHMKNMTDSCLANKAEPKCEGYFFYDLKHPTAEAGKLIAEWIRNSVALA